MKSKIPWTSVKDELPEYGERVLVTNATMVNVDGEYTMYNVGVTVRRQYVNFAFWGNPVTHWAPLPELPESEGAE